jgi:large subunit ribosomal protein L21e
MPHSYGYRAHTRYLFKRPFRRHGPLKTSTYLETYKLGDYVDIKGVGSVHKGMPHKYYHGRTGVVWNVTPRAVGVEILKRHRNRLIRKRIHVRIEHVSKSKCREEFLLRVKENDRRRREAAAKKERVNLKRSPGEPAPGQLIKTKGLQIETVTPVPYEALL